MSKKNTVGKKYTSRMHDWLVRTISTVEYTAKASCGNGHIRFYNMKIKATALHIYIYIQCIYIEL